MFNIKHFVYFWDQAIELHNNFLCNELFFRIIGRDETQQFVSYGMSDQID